MSALRWVSLFLVLAALPAAALELEPGGKVYSGNEGESVTIVAVKPRADKKVLIYLRGTESELDELVLLHRVREWNDNADYVTTRKGRDYATVNMRQRQGNKEWFVNLPGKRDSLRVRFDEEKTGKLDQAALLKRYDELGKSGELKRIETFDRKAETDEEDRALAEVAADTEKVCGTKLKLKVEWSTVSDEQVKSLSIASFCGAPLNALRSICADEDGKQAVKEKLKEVVCRFGDKLELKVDGGGVARWVTTKDEPNQDEFAKQAFMRQL